MSWLTARGDTSFLGEGDDGEGGVRPEPFGQRLGRVCGALVQGGRAVAQLSGVLIGADAVAAASDATVNAGGVPLDAAVPEGLLAPVMAEQESMRVVMGNVPGERPAESADADPPVRVWRNGFAGLVAGGFLVGPVDERLDPDSHALRFERAGVPGGLTQVVSVVPTA